MKVFSLLLIFLIERYGKIKNNESFLAVKYYLRKGYFVLMSFENSNLYQYYSINQANNYTWTKSFRTDFAESCSKENISTPLYGVTAQEIRGAKCNGRVLLNGKTTFFIDRFPFIVANIHTENECIGLAYLYEDVYYSLPFQLFIRQKINSYSYGFVPEEDHQEGYLYLGGLPNEIKNLKKGTCNVDPKNIEWGCELKGIAVNDYYLENSPYIRFYFNSNQEEIFLSKELFEKFVEKIKGNNLDSKKCRLVGYKKITFLNCPERIINTYPKIHFIIDEYAYTIPMKYFWTCRENCVSLIQYNSLLKDKMIFGTSFLNNYKTLFDYESASISFYTNENSSIHFTHEMSWGTSSKKGEKSLIKILLKIILFIKLFFIGINIIIIVSLNNNKKL